MRIAHLVIAAVAALLAQSAAAQSAASSPYPAKPIRLIVPYSAGGATDAFARPIAQKLAEQLGQPVIVENRAGADGAIGTEFVAKSPPDGYTILVNSASFMLTPFYSKNVPFDTLRDFTPIIAAGVNVRAVLVHPSLPVSSMSELIAYAKANPGRISYGLAVARSVQELAGDLLRSLGGIDMVQVAYKGGGPALKDLLGGQIQMAILVLSDVIPHVKAGRLRPLGVIEARRSKALPEVPTISETLPGYFIPDSWAGFLGPKGLPPAIVARLNGEIAKAVMTPETRAALENLGYEVMATSAEEHARMMARDVEAYGKVARTLNIIPR